MPRATKEDKFYVLAPTKTGWRKGKFLIGLNHRYEGDKDKITLADFIRFLEVSNLDPKSITFNGPDGFTVTGTAIAIKKS